LWVGPREQNGISVVRIKIRAKREKFFNLLFSAVFWCKYCQRQIKDFDKAEKSKICPRTPRVKVFERAILPSYIFRKITTIHKEKYFL
jgi:hypothetical protein